MADFVQDFRFAFRLLRKSRVATAVAVASLALGIGCTTAAFSLVEALLLRPLPALHAPETLVAVGGVHPKDGPDQLHGLSFADYLDYAGSRDGVSGLAAGADCDLTLLGSGPAERLAGLAVSANYFSVLGLKPARGRLLSPAEETAPVAVLGYGLWQRRFGGDPAVIGSGVTLNGKPFTIAGVAPEGFLGTDLRSRREVWLPLGVYSQVATGPLASFTGKYDRKQEWLSVFGRLAPGSEPGQGPERPGGRRQAVGSQPSGGDPEHVLVLSVDLAPAGYKGQQVATFYRDLLERLRRLPGIEEASMASALPVIGNDLTVDLSVDRLDEKPAAAGAAQPSARHVLVGSRYFQTMKTRLVRGRDFSPEDSSAGASAVIVNETAAHRLWGGRDPLGRRLRLAETATPFEIVGVVADTTYGSLREGAVPILYLFHGQQERSFIGGLLAAQMTVLVRTSGAPLQALGLVRETVRAMDARLPVFQISTLQDLLAATVGVERQAAALYSGLALIAMTLAMLGLYGVLTYRVTNSAREIGIRIACGAGREQVWSFVLRRSLLLVLSGVAAGLALALAASRVVASQLYGIAPLNGPTWIVTTLVLMAVALLVSIAPTRRAMRTDPAAALRSG